MDEVRRRRYLQSQAATAANAPAAAPAQQQLPPFNPQQMYGAPPMAPQYNPFTGQPLHGGYNVPQFCPYTGQRLNAPVANPYMANPYMAPQPQAYMPAPPPLPAYPAPAAPQQQQGGGRGRGRGGAGGDRGRGGRGGGRGGDRGGRGRGGGGRGNGAPNAPDHGKLLGRMDAAANGIDFNPPPDADDMDVDGAAGNGGVNNNGGGGGDAAPLQDPNNPQVQLALIQPVPNPAALQPLPVENRLVDAMAGLGGGVEGVLGDQNQNDWEDVSDDSDSEVEAPGRRFGYGRGRGPTGNPFR